MKFARKLIESRYPNDKVYVYLVSSANHSPRVLRDATKFFANSNIKPIGVPADTSYGGKGPEDVVIFELGQPASKAG